MRLSLGKGNAQLCVKETVLVKSDVCPGVPARVFGHPRLTGRGSHRALGFCLHLSQCVYSTNSFFGVACSSIGTQEVSDHTYRCVTNISLVSHCWGNIFETCQNYHFPSWPMPHVRRSGVSISVSLRLVEFLVITVGAILDKWSDQELRTILWIKSIDSHTFFPVARVGSC